MTGRLASSAQPLFPAERRSDAAVSDRMIVTIITIELVLVVVTQKLALPLGGDLQVASALVIQFIVFGVLMMKGLLRIHTIRSLIFLSFLGYAALVHSTLNSNAGYSFGSILLLSATLAIYCFTIPIGRSAYYAILNNFQRVAAVAGILLFFNWGTQFAGLGIFDLEKYIPDGLMYHFYVYMNKLYWDQPWIKPNGIFFLEVSHLSQFIGMALVIELAIFRRIYLIGFLAIALLSSFGGTGTILVVASLPFLAFLVPRKILALGVVAAPLMLGAAATAGVLDNFTGRLSEFGTQDTSGYNRFIRPAIVAVEALGRDGGEGIFGSGAGTIAAGDRAKKGVGGFAWSAYCKVIFEYGLMGFILWLALTTTSIFNRGAPFIVCWIVFLQYNFLNGALAVPIHTVYCYVLAAGYTFLNPEEALEPRLGNSSRSA